MIGYGGKAASFRSENYTSASSASTNQVSENDDDVDGSDYAQSMNYVLPEHSRLSVRQDSTEKQDDVKKDDNFQTYLSRIRQTIHITTGGEAAEGEQHDDGHEKNT